MGSADAPADRWWTEETVAVVTGGNKGIGLAIVRQLAQEGVTVVLSARDKVRGLQAVQELHAEGLKNVVFRQLDISNTASVTAFVEWIQHTFGGLDILVNNASVLHMDNVYANAKESIDINYFGTKNLTEQLLAHFKASPAGARIVTLTSSAGWLSSVSDEKVREQLMDPTTFTLESIDKVANNYIDVCKAGGESAAAGYGTAYSFTKVLQNAYSRLLAQRVANRPQGSTLYVNCVNPGMVDTEMLTKFKASIGDATFAELQKQKVLEDKPRGTSKGAATPVWLALYPMGGPSGRFCGPLLKKIGFTPEMVGQRIDEWLALGVKLSRQLQFDEFALSQSEKVRIYHYYVPVFLWCKRELEIHSSKFKPGEPVPALVIGISAPQGCGKTTIVYSLEYLFNSLGSRAASISIDDFYLTAAEQKKLSAGNPGNKLLEVLLFEGWMLGFEPQKESVVTAVDPQLAPVNKQLPAYYDAWHKMIDSWIVIHIDDHNWVFKWRLQAEVAMRADGKIGMTDEQVADFVSRYMPAYKAYLPALYGQGPKGAREEHTLILNIDENRNPIG